ncbi:MAG: hypothetical protein AABX38_05860 [Candidatus Micrarchaeota archaeon]
MFIFQYAYTSKPEDLSVKKAPKELVKDMIKLAQSSTSIVSINSLKERQKDLEKAIKDLNALMNTKNEFGINPNKPINDIMLKAMAELVLASSQNQGMIRELERKTNAKAKFSKK